MADRSDLQRPSQGAPAHEQPAFANAATYTVAVTYTVAGGARPATAKRHARKLAARLADVAARAARAVEVTAMAGPSRDGQLTWAQPVRFDAANTDPTSHTHSERLPRYLDPDHEWALASLADANAAARTRRDADQQRRATVGCRNIHPSGLEPGPRPCRCVYCQPDAHLTARRAPTPPGPFDALRCLCGAGVAAAGQRCRSHTDTAVVVLDGDPPALRLLADDLEETT